MAVLITDLYHATVINISLIPSPHTTAIVTCIICPIVFFQFLATFSYNSVNQLCEPIREQNSKTLQFDWMAQFLLLQPDATRTGDDSYVGGLGMRLDTCI